MHPPMYQAGHRPHHSTSRPSDNSPLVTERNFLTDQIPRVDLELLQIFNSGGILGTQRPSTIPTIIPLQRMGKQTTFFDFPLPGGIPTRDISPENTPRPFRISSVKRFPMPTSTETSQTLNGREMEIGMAIGSPPHMPSTWQPQGWDGPSPGFAEEASPEVSHSPSRHKSKWKKLGGLLGQKKQTTAPTQGFEQVQAERVSSEDDIQLPNRGRSVTDSSIGKKSELQRSNTVTRQIDTNSNQDQHPEIQLDGIPLQEENAQQWGVLDVKIPSVEMERYSIMFGSLLQDQAGSLPTLLARRQATIDRLMAVTDELAQKEKELQEKELQEKEKQFKHRRATSPQPTKSPSFSLFPNTPTRESRMGRTASSNARVARSSSSPATLSPSRASFATRPGKELQATLTEPGPHIPVMGYALGAARPKRSIRIKLKKQPELKLIMRPAESQAVQDSPEERIQRQSWVFTPDKSQLNLSPDSEVEDASSLLTSAVYQQASKQTASKSVLQSCQPSISGSATSYSEHSPSSSASATFSTTHSNTQSPLSGTASPYEGSAIKELPLPITRLTLPPQTQRTRGRSGTTSASPKPNPQPVELPVPLKRQTSEVFVSRTLSSPLSPLNQHPVSRGRPRSVKSTENDDEQEKEDEEEQEVEEEATIFSPVVVSVARQVSVMRQQSQHLVPIHANFQGTPGTILSSKGNSKSKSNRIDKIPTTKANRSVRPTMRGRADTEPILASACPAAPSLSKQAYSHNFPSPLIKNLQSGANISHVTSPLTAVAKSTKEEWDTDRDGMRIRTSPKARPAAAVQSSRGGEQKKGEGGEDRETYVAAAGPSVPTLVIVNGNISCGGPGGTTMTMQDTKKGDGIAQRRRKTRAERNGRGHQYKKSENAIVECV